MKNNIDILVIDDEQVILDAIKKIADFEGLFIRYMFKC